jgi:YVTN family beta-propeller protein
LDGIQINTQVPINSKANQFFPNEEPGGILAIDNGQITFIPDNIDSPWKQIDLKPSQNSIMTNVLPLPLKGRSVVFSGPDEYSLIDEFQNKVINTGIIGREGVRAAKLLGETVLALGVSLTGSLLSGNPYVFIPETRPSFLYALARADEEFLYVFNTSSNDITIINTENGSIEDIIPVGANCKGISITPDGKYVFAINSSRVTIINTETNKEHTEIKLETNLGIIKDLQFVDKSGNLVVLFENAVQFWDIGQGEATLILPLTSKPEFLICPTFRE